MKYAFLICGPESSGTGLLKNILLECSNTKYKFGDFTEENAKYNNFYVNSSYEKSLYSLINVTINNNTTKSKNELDKPKCWSFTLVPKENKKDLFYIKHIGIPFGNFYPNIEHFSKQLLDNNFIVKIIIPIRNNNISEISTISRFKYNLEEAKLYKELSRKYICNIINKLDSHIFSFDTFMYLKNNYLNYFTDKVLNLPFKFNNKIEIRDVDSKYFTIK